jgi:hypothetical protein
MNATIQVKHLAMENCGSEIGWRQSLTDDVRLELDSCPTSPTTYLHFIDPRAREETASL